MSAAVFIRGTPSEVGAATIHFITITGLVTVVIARTGTTAFAIGIVIIASENTSDPRTRLPKRGAAGTAGIVPEIGIGIVIVATVTEAIGTAATGVVTAITS
jgi:hypothetical protein